MYIIYIPWLLTWTEWADQVLSWLKCIHLRGDRDSRDDKSEKRLRLPLPELYLDISAEENSSLIFFIPPGSSFSEEIKDE